MIDRVLVADGSGFIGRHRLRALPRRVVKYTIARHPIQFVTSVARTGHLSQSA